MTEEVDQLKDALPPNIDPKNDPPPDALEPPGEDPPAEPGAAAAEEPKEGEEETRLEPAYKSDPRNEIYARRSAALAQEVVESDQLFNGDGTDPAAAARELANQGGTVKIKVYGEEREVPMSEVVEAGVATLQKDAAADQKMTRAATKEAALRVEEERLLRIATNLRNGLDENGQPIGPKPPAKGAADRTEDQMKAVKDAADAYHKAVFSGDVEASNAALLHFNEVSGKAGGGTGLPEIIKSVEDAVLRNIDARSAAAVAQAGAEAAERDRIEANRIFREDFPEITKDPDVFAMAKGLASSLSKDPAWAGKSRAAIAKEVGGRIKAKLQPTSLDATLEVRRRAKQDLSRPSAGGRQPAPAEPTVPNNQAYVRQLQVNSGSNSAPKR